MNKIKKEIDLPFEEGVIYTTKFQTGELFLLNKIIWKESKEDGVVVKKMILFLGVFSSSKHLGDCPLNIDRLQPKTETAYEEIELCEMCKKPI